MIRIEKNKEYEFRLMPNFYDVTENVLQLKSCISNLSPNHTPSIMEQNFCYVLQDGKIQSMIFGEIIKSYIQKCLLGFYGTSEGYFISNTRVDQYHANKDKSIIVTDLFEEFFEDEENPEKYTLYKDVVYYERIVLFNIREKYHICFKTRDNSGFMEIYNLGIKEVDPLYKDGMEKDSITSLYNGVDNLKVEIEKYKIDLVEKHPEVKFLFDNDATLFSIEYQSIKTAMNKVLELQTYSAKVNKFAKNKFDEKFPYDPSNPVHYKNFTVEDLQTLRIWFEYGDMDDYFDVKI